MRQRLLTITTQPEFWLVSLLLWILLSAARSLETPWSRAALTEALRWSTGIGLTLALGNGLQRTKHAAYSTVILVSLLAALGVWGGLLPEQGGMSGPYREHQLYGSVLLLLLPVCAAVAITDRATRWRLGAIGAAGAGLFCLFLSQTRSAWAGLVVAALTFGWLWLIRNKVGRNRWKMTASTLAALSVGFLVLWVSTAPSDLRQPLTTRIASLSSLQTDESWQERLAVWRGASRLIAAHPWMGIGLGRYPGTQWAWTGKGRLLSSLERPSLSEEAHNFYLQTAAEIGLIGLGLYGAALAAFVLQAGSQLRQRPTSHRRDVWLIASLSALTGQAVDAMASPSWQFAEASWFFWAMLGFGLAALRFEQSETATAPLSKFPRRIGQFTLSGATAVILTAYILPIGLLPPVEAYTIPTGFTYAGYSLTPTSPTTVSLAQGNTVTFILKCLYKNNSNPNDIRSQDVSNEGPIAPTGTYFTVSGTTHTGTTTFFGATSATRNTLTIDSRDVNKTLTCQAHFSNNGFNQPTSNFVVNVTP